MIRTAIRALSLTLGLAMFLVLPAAAAEPAPHCAVPTSAPTLSLPEIFGTVPEPQMMSGEVSCDQCPGGPNGAYRQCHVRCWSNYGWCVDQCYADADTCELTNCICLPC